MWSLNPLNIVAVRIGHYRLGRHAYDCHWQRPIAAPDGDTCCISALTCAMNSVSQKRSNFDRSYRELNWFKDRAAISLSEAT